MKICLVRVLYAEAWGDKRPMLKCKDCPCKCTERSEQMRQRTPSEIKAYGDGYAEAYKEFCHLLERHDKDKAIRKMKIFADVVALTVEIATDEERSE